MRSAAAREECDGAEDHTVNRFPRTDERSLYDVPVGDHAVIAAANVGDVLGRRLRELGLRAGTEVTVTQKTAGGGRVVKTRGTTYALDATALRGILVSASRARRSPRSTAAPPPMGLPTARRPSPWWVRRTPASPPSSTR